MKFKLCPRTLWRAIWSLLLLAATSQTLMSQPFVHPGCLESPADFARMNTKVTAGESPWIDGWHKLTANFHSSPSYRLQGPVSVVYRGRGSPENYGKLYNDIAACYQNSLRWRITGNTACADKAGQIMNGWSATLKSIQGTSDRFLAAGLYGYEFACAGENMRGYHGLSASDFAAFQSMMTNIFYPMNHEFLVNHNGACISHYWANWDLCNIASIMAIGVLCDDRSKYNEALDYWKGGAGNGAIANAVPFTYQNGALGQGQEEGRDQGHSGLDVALEGVICQIAMNQGDDLFGYLKNRVLAMSEYFAEYNLSNSVPYTTYDNCDHVNQTVISSSGRGNLRPCWELIYNYYHQRARLDTVYSGQYAAKVRPEGGGGDYGPNSGGYDQLGFGTLTCSINYPPIANGKYYIINHADGKYLDNLGVSTNGAPVAQWQKTGSNQQKWNVAYNGDGYYKIQCVSGGRFLEAPGHNTDGSTVKQWSASTSFNQQWMIVPVGSYDKIIARNSGKCLAIGKLSTNGAAIEQWHSDPSLNQQWTFTLAP